MSRIIQPVVSPRGRVIVLTGATLWLIAAMVLTATPDGAVATPRAPDTVTTHGAPVVVEQIAGTNEVLFRPHVISDRRGGLFIADYGNHRVVQVDEQFRMLRIFGREGAGPGEMQVPYGVAVDSAGNVFVADLQLQRINKFAADGTFVKSVAAPQAATLLVDSEDRLLVYPAPGPALMRRYSNDLDPGDELLVETDDMLHRSRKGVLMAMDSRDRLFLLDQANLMVTVYDRDMRPIRQWPVTGPELLESVARGLESAQRNNPDSRVRVPAFQSMALDPTGDHLAFTYLVRVDDETTFSRTVYYSTIGEPIAVEDRGDSVFANALLPDGRLVEGTAEALLIFNRGLQQAGASRGN